MSIKKHLGIFKSSISNNKQSVKSIAAIFGSNMTSSLLSAVGGLLIARFIGPDVTGLYRSFTIPLTYLTFLHLGTFDGLWRQIPFYMGKDMPEKVSALASAAGAWNWLVSIVVSFGFVGYALYSLWHHDLSGMAGWLSQACCVWFVFYGGYLGATYRTINQFTALARIQLVQAVLNFGLVFIAPFLAFYGLCIRAGAVQVAGVLLCQRNRPMRVPLRLERTAFKELVSIGLPFSVMGSLYTSIWIATENALILALGGVTSLGLFTVAVVLRDGMQLLPQAVNQVLMPRIVERYSRTGSIKGGNSQLTVITVIVTLIMVVLVMVVSVALDFFVPFAIPKYIAGIPLIKVCLWYSVVQAAGLPLNSLFATGEWWVYGRGILVGIAVFLITAYLLTNVLGGVLAVAVGSLLGRAARTLVAYIEIFILLKRDNDKTSCCNEKR